MTVTRQSKALRSATSPADGKQPGDPERAAEIFIELAESEQPPLHLYLGQDAYNRASEKLTAMTKELEEWKSTTISADYR